MLHLPWLALKKAVSTGHTFNLSLSVSAFQVNRKQAKEIGKELNKCSPIIEAERLDKYFGRVAAITLSEQARTLILAAHSVGEGLRSLSGNEDERRLAFKVSRRLIEVCIGNVDKIRREARLESARNGLAALDMELGEACKQVG